MGLHQNLFPKIWWNLIYASDSDPETFSRSNATHLFWRFWWFKNFKDYMTRTQFDTLKIHDN